jgi:hypothetical protein
MNLRHSSTHLRQCSAHRWQVSLPHVSQRAAHRSQISTQISQILTAKAEPRDMSTTHKRQMAAQSRHIRPHSAMSPEVSQQL